MLEDMLRSCVIYYEGSWDRHMHLVEFVYNNSFHSSIGMAPYEALYGRKCRTSLCWIELSKKKIIGPDLIQETEEKVKIIRERLKVATDRQNVIPRPDEVHCTCNCTGAYVHQVPL